MPVLRCACGSEVSVSPGRLLASGAAGIPCPNCGQSVAVHGSADPSRLEPVAALPAIEDSARDQDVPRPNWRTTATASGISLAVHLSVLITLAFIVFQPLAAPELETIVVETAWQKPEGADSAIEVSNEVGGSTISMSPAAAQSSFVAAATATTSQLVPIRVDGPVLKASEASQVAAPLPSLANATLTATVRTVRRSEAGKGGLIQGRGAGQATSGLLDGIRKEAASGPVQVVWLMDASVSMNVDRQEVAAKLYPFYQEMARRDKAESFPLLSSVVRFGAAPVELVHTSRDFGQVTRAVAALQDDPSGQENVMAAVQFCINRYSRWQGTLMIMLWTDESGDDTAMLEDTIRMCRKRDVIIHVVGPNAVFGSERGTHVWRDPVTGLGFRLPVKRGPETSLPERLMVPYWHDAPIPQAKMSGHLVADQLPWHGGPMRDGLLSGFGPYALTRLALETGGTFTILNRPGDRTTTTLEELQNYIPDYSAAREYYSEVQSIPLRKAVSDASLLVWQAPELEPPPLTFLFSRRVYYPFEAFIDFQRPENFRNAFRENLQTAIAGSRAEQAILEQALACFEGHDLENEYIREHSTRWKAWYDLNYGRLLANTVRHIEYQLTCAAILQTGGLNADTNHVVFRPSDRYRGGSVSESRAIQARTLLERCRKNNPGTPWDLLAQWELDRELGLQAQQIVIPPPPPPRPGPVSPPRPATKVTFPKL